MNKGARKLGVTYPVQITISYWIFFFYSASEWIIRSPLNSDPSIFHCIKSAPRNNANNSPFLNLCAARIKEAINYVDI
jgi:hypothetical protein